MFAWALGKRFVYVPVPLALARASLSPPVVQRFFGMPTQALDYFDDAVRHDATQASRDLGRSASNAPGCADYVPSLVAFYRSHRDGAQVQRRSMT